MKFYRHPDTNELLIAVQTEEYGEIYVPANSSDKLLCSLLDRRNIAMLVGLLAAGLCLYKVIYAKKLQGLTLQGRAATLESTP